MSIIANLLIIFSITCFILALFDAKPKTYVSNVPNTKLVNEVILFTNVILQKKGIKRFPTFRIQYYKHKKWSGYFNNEIVVYLKNHDDIPSLTNTVLHEVGHYIQSKTQQKEFKKYEEYTETLGYFNNPFEVDARNFASKWQKECITHLINKGVIGIKS